MEDTCQLGGAHVLMLDVLMMMNVIMDVLVMKVMKGLVTVTLLLQVKVLVEVFVLLVVKVFVAFVVEVLLFSLSPTAFPRTRPAARVWGLGFKGLGFQFAAPAPGRRCSGPFS